jgi:hypothetical protein
LATEAQISDLIDRLCEIEGEVLFRSDEFDGEISTDLKARITRKAEDWKADGIALLSLIIEALIELKREGPYPAL